MRKNNEDFLLDFPDFSASGNTRTRSMQTAVHTIYLDGEITAPADYRDAMAVLETASPNDKVIISINSGGGRMDTGVMLINGIKACQAPVRAQIHADCGSMATGIALACDDWQLGEFAYFFIHTATYGMLGKDQEVKTQAEFMDKYVDKFLKSLYTGFLSAKELKDVAAGKDFWITLEDENGKPGLASRLAAYADYREKQQEKIYKKQQNELRKYWREMNAQAQCGAKAD